MGLSLGGAAEAAQVSKTAIKNWIEQGKLVASKGDDGSYDIDPDELQKVVAKRASGKKGSKPAKDTSPSETPVKAASASVREAQLQGQVDVLQAEKVALQEALRKSEVLNDRLMNQIEDLQEKYNESVTRAQLLLEGPLKAVTERKKLFGIF